MTLTKAFGDKFDKEREFPHLPSLVAMIIKGIEEF